MAVVGNVAFHPKRKRACFWPLALFGKALIAIKIRVNQRRMDANASNSQLRIASSKV